jgi:phosphopantetheinyl transferase
MSLDGIDLWQFTLDCHPGAIGGFLALLSPEERKRFREYESAEIAHAFAIRRATRRLILAGYLGIEPLEVQTCNSSSGKPEIAEPSPGLHFSASHSSDRGVVAVTRRFPIGVDVERVRKIETRALAARILSAHERVEFEHTNPDDRDAGIFSAWTAKEAVVKGIGVGLDLDDLPQINFQFSRAPAVWAPAHFGGRMAAYSRWYVYALAPSEGCFVSIAAPAKAAVTIVDAHEILAKLRV